MEKLYVWFNTLGRKLKDIPQNADIWLSDSDSLIEFRDNPVKGKWISFNPYSDTLPLKQELKLPSVLYLFIKIKNKPIFDWCYIHHHVMAVSEHFLDYLLRNDVKNQIEIATLNIIGTDGTVYDNTKYFAIRIIRFDDEKFSFNETFKKRAAGLRGKFMYPKMELLKQDEKQNIYFLLEFCYHSCLILNESSKDYILSNFYSPEIYLLSDFPQAFNNRLDNRKLPQMIN